MFQDKVKLEVPDDNQKIWRFMDFSKYVDLLTTSKLYFVRADKFEDTFDCSSMQFFDESARKWSSDDPQIKEWPRKLNDFQRLFVYLNCWHISNDPSAALWKLYSENIYETVTIQSTFKKLKSETESKEDIRITKVRYDPENAGKSDERFLGCKFFSSSGWESIIYKRKSFAHEKELRAIIYREADKLRHTTIRNEIHFEQVKSGCPPHIRIEINPSKLIEKVYVSPLAKDLFVELVKKVSGELGGRVQKSDLYELY
jgi:hypothetical protein